MEHSGFICKTCGTQYPPSQAGARERPTGARVAEPGEAKRSGPQAAPEHCPICEDERQYVPIDGQHWTTLAEMQGAYTNRFLELAPSITGIITEPHFAIGQRACLIQTELGNILWDCIAHLDEATIAQVKALGGLKAIAISHPHFYTTIVEWSRAFDNAPIYLHRTNQPWVMRPDQAIHFWDGETYEIIPGSTLVRCGGHFPGSTILHWSGAAAGQGAIFTGDSIRAVADQRYVSFMYSYPNLIPLNEPAVRHIVEAIQPFAFQQLYDGWQSIPNDAKAAVLRSAERYITHICSEA